MSNIVTVYKKAEKYLLREANRGDPEAQNSLAVIKMHLALELKDKEYLNDAEILLKKSSSKGFKPAKQFLEHSWSSLRDSYIKIINNDED